MHAAAHRALQAGTQRVYRVPSLLATSFDRAVASRFLRMHVPEDMPKVVWKVLLDPAHGCCHVNYIDKTECDGESEYLFSAYSTFTVSEVKWSATPTRWTTPHRITLIAKPDNKLEPEDVPSAPWY